MVKQNETHSLCKLQCPLSPQQWIWPLSPLPLLAFIPKHQWDEMPKLWALKDFTSSFYKLHKITDSPSPVQKHLVKHVLYCFSLTGQAAKARQYESGSKQWSEHIWYWAESLAGEEKAGGGYGQQQIKIILCLCLMLWESPRASSTFCFSSITEQLFAAYILVSFLQHVVTFGSISAMLTS